jgi:hypothetical protein
MIHCNYMQTSTRQHALYRIHLRIGVYLHQHHHDDDIPQHHLVEVVGKLHRLHVVEDHHHYLHLVSHVEVEELYGVSRVQAQEECEGIHGDILLIRLYSNSK